MMRRQREIPRRLTLLPWAICIQHRRRPRRLLLGGNVIPQCVQTDKQYIRSAHHPIHIHRGLPALFRSSKNLHGDFLLCRPSHISMILHSLHSPLFIFLLRQNVLHPAPAATVSSFLPDGGKSYFSDIYPGTSDPPVRSFL